jgi:hypothetical protein
MRRRACAAILAALIIGGFGIVGQAQSGFYDGNTLIEWYKEVEKSAEDKSQKIYLQGMFAGYVVGVSDALESKICWPPEPEKVKVKAVSAIVGNYLKAHPEIWGQSGDVIILKALKEAYPCPKKKVGILK